MPVVFHPQDQSFHLYNEQISYVFTILKNGQLGQLYFGKRIADRESFAHMLQLRSCVMAPCTYRDDPNFSLESIKQEYPAYGTGDYRDPAYQMRLQDGSRITNFVYLSHSIEKGKPELQGLPATYGEAEDVTTLAIRLRDEKIGCEMVISYHVFEHLPVITRDVRFENHGTERLMLERAMSASVDFYDSDFEMVQLDGAWSRERHVHTRKLQGGIQNISSTRGASGHFHNPFLALKRCAATENSGEVYGFSLVYSGNFLAQAEVDTYDVTRVLLGIHPFEFEWALEAGGTFQTPEAVLVYSSEGLNGMSHAFHDLYREHLMRGVWKKRTRPILLNNWEATYFDFTEESILNIAKKGKELGVELFVLDDGWFGKRNDDYSSLGDWNVNYDKIPSGIDGLCRKINDLGLDFGLWFEPEMVNEISELYKAHPEWVIGVPGRDHSYGRNQYVLDFANPEVVDYIFEAMKKVLENANIRYIKWDMNRNITEAYSATLPAERQKEFFHRYILGVYDLYDRLTTHFPEILFESCASGGGRFDPGMLYYAPQTWTSDDTDAVERLEIQYGTSMVYPLISIGSHVSASPNHQMMRDTPLQMRGDVAYFGTFGYELDVTKMTEQEAQQVKEQIRYFKAHRDVIQYGDFYRLEDGSRRIYSWMAVSKDRKRAVMAYYKVLATPNTSLKKIRAAGLDPDKTYYCEERKMEYSGDELMNFGMLCNEEYAGSGGHGTDWGDFTSQLFTLEAVENG